MSAISAVSSQPSLTPTSDVRPPAPTSKPVDSDGDHDGDHGGKADRDGGLRITA